MVPVSPSPENVARPAASVVADPLPNNDAPPGPLAIVAVTVTPACGEAFPPASSSWIAGWVANALPLVAPPGCVLTPSCVGTPAVTLIGDEVAPVRPAALNASVYDPMGPETPRPEKVATPLLVFAVVDPVRLAPAEIETD